MSFITDTEKNLTSHLIYSLLNLWISCEFVMEINNVSIYLKSHGWHRLSLETQQSGKRGGLQCVGMIAGYSLFKFSFHEHHTKEAIWHLRLVGDDIQDGKCAHMWWETTWGKVTEIIRVCVWGRRGWGTADEWNLVCRDPVWTVYEHLQQLWQLNTENVPTICPCCLLEFVFPFCFQDKPQQLEYFVCEIIFLDPWTASCASLNVFWCGKQPRTQPYSDGFLLDTGCISCFTMRQQIHEFLFSFGGLSVNPKWSNGVGGDSLTPNAYVHPCVQSEFVTAGFVFHQT